MEDAVKVALELAVAVGYPDLLAVFLMGLKVEAGELEVLSHAGFPVVAHVEHPQGLALEAGVGVFRRAVVSVGQTSGARLPDHGGAEILALWLAGVVGLHGLVDDVGEGE